MAFGFPASYSESVSVDANKSDYIAAIKKSLKSLGWSIQAESDEKITANTGLSIWSWGEKVIVEFPEGDSITVTSKCSFQVFDWGKNMQNVSHFISKLHE